MAETKRLVKVSVFYTKKAGVSDEEFHKFWTKTYGPEAAGLPIFQKHVLKYNQYHNEPNWKSEAVAMNVPVLDYDGVAEVWLDSIESLKLVLGSEDYQKKVVASMNNIINSEATRFMFGYDIVQLDQLK